ncbi:MAG TPA: nuclear transport factor 2 family protein [Trebonia sp.]|jgi:hypothetical protein|nr:nuclear transport factor 2 family protein [Trebonia sp.]
MAPGTRVQHALDYVEIIQVISTYSLGQDGHQRGDNNVLEHWDRAFAPDATTDYSAAGAPVCSYRELAAWMRGEDGKPARMGRYFGWQHMLSIPVVTIDGDRAQARTDYSAVHKISTEGPAGARFDCQGAFHDTLARTDDGWRITHRRLEIYFGEEVATRNSMLPAR